MKPGNYLYNFVQDGKIILDTFNQNTRLREDTGEISSYLIVPERSYALERNSLFFIDLIFSRAFFYSWKKSG